MGLPLNKIELFLNTKAYGNSLFSSKSSCAYIIDSRCLKNGDVFIALNGENHDSHKFITESLIKKASLIIVNKKWYNRAKPTKGKFLVVDDTVKAMLKLASMYLKYLKVKVVAITGSNGKTTTRAMALSVLSSKYNVFATKKNFNNRIGMPLSVFEMTKKHEVALLELGTNHFGEIEELSLAINPDIALITNIGSSHLEFLKTKNGVLKAKMEILAGLKKNGTLILCGDDIFLQKIKHSENYKTIYYGFSDNSITRGKSYSSSLLSGTNLKMSSGTNIKINIPGRGAASNALAALCLGKTLGVSYKLAIPKLEKVVVPGNRMKIIKSKGLTIVADCYNANPDSFENALSLLSSEKSGIRRIAVLGDMGELGKKSKALHREVGALVSKNLVDVLLTIGSMGSEIAKGAVNAGHKNVFAFENSKLLINAIKSSTKKGDIILVKASRFMNLDSVVEKLYKGKK